MEFDKLCWSVAFCLLLLCYLPAIAIAASEKTILSMVLLVPHLNGIRPLKIPLHKFTTMFWFVQFFIWSKTDVYLNILCTILV